MAPPGKQPIETPWRTKAQAFAALVGIQTTIGILYRVAQSGEGGKFSFNTKSAIAMAEFTKLCMSYTFHLMATASATSTGDSISGTSLKVALDRSNVLAANASAKAALSKHAILHVSILGFLYTFNNQLMFYVNTIADPGSISLFKSGSTVITALLLRHFSGRQINHLQWTAIIMQVAGLITLQYDPCKGSTILGLSAYLFMSLSTCITAVCSARNEYVLKNFDISMHVQNCVLYGSGFTFNMLAYLLLPNPTGGDDIGFFEGYDNVWAIGVVVSNAMIGLAITAVYKYADAIIKTFAQATTAVLLVIFSVAYLGLRPTVTAWMGVLVVVVATHMYSTVSRLKL